MPFTLQAKLLRVLQEQEFQRLGGKGTISVDIRILAATNQDLDNAIREGRFRMDLYYRLCGVSHRGSAAEENGAKIFLSWRIISLEKFAAKAKKSIPTISDDTLHVLTQHDFPGNVRELENAIESAVLRETTDLLQRESLPPYLTQQGSQTATSDPTDTTDILPLDEVVRRAIIQALEATDGNIPDAARALRIGRSTLYRKLEKYNLRP